MRTLIHLYIDKKQTRGKEKKREKE